MQCALRYIYIYIVMLANRINSSKVLRNIINHGINEEAKTNTEWRKVAGKIIGLRHASDTAVQIVLEIHFWRWHVTREYNEYRYDNISNMSLPFQPLPCDVRVER